MSYSAQTDPVEATIAHWPIPRRKLSEELALRLETMMREGTFPPGSRLPPERELMKIFGVGRASIREALYALHRMSLVEIRNGERPLVRSPTPRSLLSELSGAARHCLAEPDGPRQFQEARRLFETGVAELAAERCGAAEAQRLQAALDANIAARGDAARFERADVAFHYALATITGNPIFTAVHDALSEWLTRQRTLALRVAGAEAIALQGHQRIFEAVRRNRRVAAGAAMARHLDEIAALIGTADQQDSKTRPA